MPTILVFLGCVSLFPALTSLEPKINFLDIIGLVITLTAILIETLADNQMWKYRKSRQKDQNICQTGLWKFSRHPNYFGEISFWWGLYFFALGVSITNWWMIVGPLSITLLFLLISIPMIEKRHQKRKPEYLDYNKRVSKIIPWINKNET
jgi:steroid 5-alpha reductase family enzyme